MLEPSKRYEFEMLEPDGGRSFIRGISQWVGGTLVALKLEDGSERVFNTAASTFVSAQEWRPVTGSKFRPGAPPKGDAPNG